MRSPCWKYKANYSPCSKPCSPCRPVCSPCPPPVDRCRRTADDCCDRERFSSSCSPLYSPSCPSECPERVPCCPRERFASSCTSQGPWVAEPPDAECAPCDLDRYCIRSSPISCNPCLGRRSFRDCSSFTRPSVPYCNWCYVNGDEKQQQDSRRSSAKKKSRKSVNKRDSRSSSVNKNDRNSTSSSKSFRSSMGSSVSDPGRISSRKSKSPSDLQRQTINDPNKRLIMAGKKRRSRVSSQKSSLGDSRRRSSSKSKASVGDVDSGEIRQSTVDSSVVADPIEDDEVQEDGRLSQSRKASRKPLAAESESARRCSSKLVEFNDDIDAKELRQSFVARASRQSSANDNPQGKSPSGSSFADNDDDNNDDNNDEERETVADRRRSSSVTSAPRATRTSSQQRNVRNSSTSRQSSRSSSIPRKLSTLRARFSSKTKLSSLKSIFRKRPTPYRLSKSSRSATVSSSLSSGSSPSSGRRSTRRASCDDDNEEDCADNLVKPLAECIAGVIHKSVAKPCDCRDPCCRCQIRTVCHPPRRYCDIRCTPCNPRDRFSLCRMPFYRSGHRVISGTTRRQQPGGASVVAYGDRQSYSGNAALVPDAQTASRQMTLTAPAGQARLSSPQSQDAAFISSMPPPGTPIPRPTITGTSTRQVSVGAPRPPYAGYREHYVTTTNQTVRVNQQQNVNYASNAAARPSLDDGRRSRSDMENRNQSGATSADVGTSSHYLSDVVTDTRDASSPVATAQADRTASDHDTDLAAMFEQTHRGIMEAFDNAQQIVR